MDDVDAGDAGRCLLPSHTNRVVRASSVVHHNEMFNTGEGESGGRERNWISNKEIEIILECLNEWRKGSNTTKCDSFQIPDESWWLLMWLFDWHNPVWQSSCFLRKDTLGYSASARLRDLLSWLTAKLMCVCTCVIVGHLVVITNMSIDTNKD